MGPPTPSCFLCIKAQVTSCFKKQTNTLTLFRDSNKIESMALRPLGCVQMFTHLVYEHTAYFKLCNHRPGATHITICCLWEPSGKPSVNNLGWGEGVARLRADRFAGGLVDPWWERGKKTITTGLEGVAGLSQSQDCTLNKFRCSVDQLNPLSIWINLHPQVNLDWV